MQIRVRDRIYVIDNAEVTESELADFIYNVLRRTGEDRIPRNLNKYWKCRIDGYGWGDVAATIIEDLSLGRISPAKKEKPIPEMEGEIVINREDLANELANYQLKKEGCTPDKNVERLNFLVDEYLVLIDMSRPGNE